MEKHHQSIKGIVLPIEWDKDGRSRKIAVMTFDEDMFAVASNHFEQVMNQHLRQIVSVDGEVSMRGNMKQITVHRLLIHKMNPG